MPLVCAITAVAPAFGAAPVAEAWWTGPIVASSGATLPRGHALVEPYMFDTRSKGFDYAGSLTYLLYGATDRLTVGLIPTFGSARSVGSENSRHVGINDVTLTAQWRAHRAEPGDLVPTWSLVLQENVPLGRYDRLAGDADRGLGAGAFATLVGFYAQRDDALSDHALRTRLNLTYTVPMRAKVHGHSVFGTPESFRGKARPGQSAFIDLSVEYSLSRQWAIATDLFHRRTAAGSVRGSTEAGGSYAARLPAQRSFGVAPAVEYSWSAARGILVGVRRIFKGTNSRASWTPVFAFNAYL
jgi:hypothetical protein